MAFQAGYSASGEPAPSLAWGWEVGEAEPEEGGDKAGLSLSVCALG